MEGWKDIYVDSLVWPWLSGQLVLVNALYCLVTGSAWREHQAPCSGTNTGTGDWRPLASVGFDSVHSAVILYSDGTLTIR